jgi:hypothetical protein
VTQQQAAAAAPIGSVGEAEQVITHLQEIMDSLIATVEEETARVRAGQLHEAAELEASKSELARQYTADTGRLVASKAFVAEALPDALEALRRRHDTFNALLQINLTVLATAHAVSEGIIRGVSSELARKQTPSSYGSSGRASVPNAKVSPPMAICRTL